LCSPLPVVQNPSAPPHRDRRAYLEDWPRTGFSTHSAPLRRQRHRPPSVSGHHRSATHTRCHAPASSPHSPSSRAPSTRLRIHSPSRTVSRNGAGAAPRSQARPRERVSHHPTSTEWSRDAPGHPSANIHSVCASTAHHQGTTYDPSPAILPRSKRQHTNGMMLLGRSHAQRPPSYDAPSATPPSLRTRLRPAPRPRGLAPSVPRKAQRPRHRPPCAWSDARTTASRWRTQGHPAWETPSDCWLRSQPPVGSARAPDSLATSSSPSAAILSASLAPFDALAIDAHERSRGTPPTRTESPLQKVGPSPIT